METFGLYKNLDVEFTVLAKFLAKNDEINAYPELKPEHFLFDMNRLIFERMIDANNKCYPFVMRTLCKTKDEQDYVSEMVKRNCFGDIKSYVKQLIEDSDKYNALIKSQDILERAKADRDVDVFSELSNAATRDFIERYDSSNEAMLKRLERKMQKDEKFLGIKCGIGDIDKNINNFQNGRLYVVGARSGMGKSALMCSMVENIEKKYKVGIISLEMLASELKQRIACIRGKIPHWKIEKGECEKEFDGYATALMSIKNVLISDKGGLNCPQVIALIRQMVKRAKCRIVFVDHLGLIQVSDRGNLAHEIGKVTALLKSLAKELDIPIVCLCQINRGVEREKDKRPTMADLRDSGRIEEDSDCVILLYREGYYDKIPPKTEPVEYIIAKCRNGRRGYVDGMFNSELMQFS